MEELNLLLPNKTINEIESMIVLLENENMNTKSLNKMSNLRLKSKSSLNMIKFDKVYI